MPISGPVLHRQLMDAYANAQARLEEERQKISSTKSERDDLVDHRGDALIELAEHYLPDLSENSIRNTWQEIRGSLADALMRKQDHQRRLRDALAAANASRVELENELVAIGAELDAAVESQQEVANQVEQTLRQSAEFVELSDRAAIAEAALERAEANLQEIDQDSARKLPAYEESSLFRYLHDRGFGTPQYSSRGFTRRADRWLAKFINYNRARQGYEFLKTTPEKMREIIAADRESFDTVMKELERHRDEGARRLGLQEKLAASKAIESRRDVQMKRLNEAFEETKPIEAELTEIEDTRGKYYREAISIFRGMLETTDTRELRERAKQTVELTDDQIVARLAGVDLEIHQLDSAVEDRRKSVLHIQAMMESLGQVVQRFRALQFDSSRSQFVGSLDILDELYRARNPEDVEEIWQRIRSAQRWGPTMAEKITNVAAHPMTQVLINAMAHAAGGAMEAHARRAGERRVRMTWDEGDSSTENRKRR